MKRCIAFLLATMMLLSLAACGTKRESAESVAEKAIQAAQKLDAEQMQKYWGSSDVELDDADMSTLDAECMKAMFKNLSYEIVSSEEKEDSASVNVKFTNMDIGKAFADTLATAFAKVFETAFSGEAFDEETFISEELLKNLTSGNYDKVTKEATMTFKLENDQWVLNEDCKEAVFNAMLADLDSAASTLSGEDDPNKELISEVRNWAVDDIWNDGICDMQWYYANGTSSTGETLDPEFTIKQLAKAMEKKADYDSKMTALPSEYSEISELWTKVSEQIDVLYAEIQKQGTERNGDGIDTGLYNQYFGAFDDAVNELK